MFETASFDLHAYFRRIGYEGRATPDLGTLRAIALNHPVAIPFENVDPFFRRPVALDIASLQRKIVHDGRGGYCFEHNLLLGTALTAIGYDVVGLAARVLWNLPPGAVTPRGHMLLLLHLDGSPYVVDAGFGGLTLTGPLRLAPEVEQDTPHEPFRLMPDGGDFIMQALVRGEWKALYRFDLQRQTLADYEVSSWYLSNHPRSHFITGLIAARVEPDRRYALRNREWAAHHRGGYSERHPIGSAQELRRILAEVFRTQLPEGAVMDDAFSRIAAAPAVAAPSPHQ